MLNQLNPAEIVLGHFRTLGSKTLTSKDSISVYETALFLFCGAPFAALQVSMMMDSMYLSSEAVGIIVSSASIIAGLLLNLLVLVYTLVVNHQGQLNDSQALFRKVAMHTFYNISFTVFGSLLLVLVSLMCLANNSTIKIMGNFLTFYIGPLVAISLMMVLKKCHQLISFFFVQTHQQQKHLS